VDKRPYPGFIKSYMHNGAFKSLAEVVHFYNKRNIATNSQGDEAQFVSGYPPPGYTPIFPPPEVLDNLQNSSGLSPQQAAHLQPPPDDESPDVALNGQVGNLQLTAQQEADLVSFLQTLTDGYTSPNPITVPATLSALGPPGPGSMVVQLAGKAGQSYVLQTSTNLSDWLPVSTNILTSRSGCITNALMAGTVRQFWRVVQVPDAP
jgi:hypothetical protein